MHANSQPTFLNPAQQDNLSPRLKWLLAANQRAAEKAALLRSPLEESEAELMQRPMTAQQVFGRFGALLGTLPPAAIFGRFLSNVALTGNEESFAVLLSLSIMMTVVCGIMGGRVGQFLGDYVLKLRDINWFAALPAYALIGFYWAIITGATGGLVFLGLGALVGPLFALPVGILAFTLFAPLHRLLERGGLMDSRHFWPLALGVTLSLAAFILGFN